MIIVVRAVPSVLASLLMSVTDRRPAGLLSKSMRGPAVSIRVSLRCCRRFTDSLFTCPSDLWVCRSLSRERLIVLCDGMSVLMRVVQNLSV